MTESKMDTSAITVVNVVEIEREKLESFLAAWQRRAEFMRQQPGFRSLRLLRAVTADARFGLVSLVEWESVDALRRATGHQLFYETGRQEAEELDVSGHPGVYQIALEVSAQRSTDER
jgi:heme-degrading monooxygenase HmoA